MSYTGRTHAQRLWLTAELAATDTPTFCSSSLDAHHIMALRQPAGTDTLLGWTRARALLLWRYSPAAAHRAFATGVEG